MLYYSRLDWGMGPDGIGYLGTLPRFDAQERYTASMAPTDNDSMKRNFAGEIHRLPEHRRELIFRVRRQLAEGVYEDEEKLEKAMERLMLSGDLDARD